MEMLFLILSIPLVFCSRGIRDPATKAELLSPNEERASRKYSTYSFDVPLDHFSYCNDATFKMRYMVNLETYQHGGPIFFYTGNEGSIESFIENTGIMWDLASLFKAALVFAEHRYYGKSLPPNAYKNTSTTGYLTSEQALADYAQLLNFLKSKEGHEDGSPSFPEETKVIAFGGSYGGMLAAWFRMKYANIVVGAWASSAPLKYFNRAGTAWDSFDAIVARTFQESGCNIENIRNGFSAILRLANTDDGRFFLNTIFNIDAKSVIVDENGGIVHLTKVEQKQRHGYNLVNYVREAFEYMAMTDYPYPSTFLMNMPRWPVKEACKNLNGNGIYSDRVLVAMLFKASYIYYNYASDPNYKACIDPNTCGDPATSTLGSALGWPWQECTEIVIEMCARQNSSFFPFDDCSSWPPLQSMLAYCQEAFGSTFGWTPRMLRENAVRDLYGFTVTATSNIILTQGHLDPWSGGGYREDDEGVNGPSGVYVFEIPGSAHHLDLRQPNTCDPNTVVNARYQIVQVLQCWLRDGCTNTPLKKLPPLKENPETNCMDIVNGYPWSQK